MPLAAAYKIFAWNQEKVIVIVPFLVKVVQTAVAHACNLAVHLVTAQPRRAKTDPAPYPAQKKTLLHAASTDRRQNRFLSLKKTCCVIYFN